MMGESLHGHAAVSGAIARAAALGEIMRGAGEYHFVGIGPREIYRARYLDLRRDLYDAEAARPDELIAGNVWVPHVQAFVELPLQDLDLRARMIDLLEPQWREQKCNTIMTAGKNDLLDKYLAGSSYTATWYMGLISSSGYSAIAAGDTSSSHAGWTEGGGGTAPTYSQSTRPAPAFASASGGSKATNANVVFSITGTGTAKGGFLISVSTKDGTTGVLFSAGLFTQGDRAVVNGDTINGGYTLSV